MPETTGRLIAAVDSLVRTVDELKTNVAKSSTACDQLSVRCGQLESTAAELRRYLFTGNGQPSVIQQLASIRTSLENTADDIKQIASKSVTEHRLRNSEQVLKLRMDVIEGKVSDIKQEQKGMQDDREDEVKVERSSRTQFYVAIIGGALGIIAAVITVAVPIVQSLLNK